MSEELSRIIINNNTIIKYRDYAELIVPQRNKIIICRIRHKDIPIIKLHEWHYTYKSKKHKVYYKNKDINSNTDYQLVKTLCGGEFNLIADDNLSTDNTLYFIINDVCDLIDKGKNN